MQNPEVGMEKPDFDRIKPSVEEMSVPNSGWSSQGGINMNSGVEETPLSKFHFR
jgi:hypothetical protein